MDVRLSTEQVALRDAAGQVAQRMGLHAVSDLADAERSAKLDAAVTASGWRDLRAPREDGAPWASGVEVAIVAEALGRRLADAPFLGPTMAADLRRLAGLPVATHAETVVLGSDLSVPAALEGDSVEPGAVVLEAGGAASALVLGRGAAGAVPYAVDLARKDPGAAAGGGVDLTRLATTLSAGVHARRIEGGRPLGPEDLARWHALGLAATSADLVGVMDGALALAADYARTRRQYDATIGSFQAVQHMLADAFVALEGSRSVTLHAAWAVDALSGGDALVAAAAAKAYCSRAARTVCETSIQVHGGIGNTWDCLAHVFLRRALLSADAFGGVGVNLERVLSAHLEEHGGFR
jgi:alkylation response protein AidB-like acyl-CoA dehydrogenase